MSGKISVEEFCRLTIDDVNNNDKEGLKSSLEAWNSKPLIDHELRVQVLGIALTIAEMNDYVTIAEMILEADHRSAMVINTATGRTPLQSAVQKRTSPAMINLLKIYSTIH